MSLSRIKQSTGSKPLFGDTFKVKLVDWAELNNLKSTATTPITKYDDEDDDKYKADTGFLAGYFSTFDNKDRVGDVIRAGAFTKTLKERKPKVLYYHDPTQPIGVVVDAWEDSKGLFGVIKLNTDTQKGMETYNLYKSGAMDSFSIGFQLEKYEVITDERGYKSYDIREVRLMEVSAVTFPANEMAVVTAVKDHYNEISDINTQRVLDTVAKADSVEELIAALTLVKQTPATEEEVANLFFESLEAKSDQSVGADETTLANAQVVNTKSDEPANISHSILEIFESLVKENKNV